MTLDITTFSQLLRTREKGQLDADASHAMKTIFEEMHNILLDQHAVSEGEITIKIKFKNDRDGSVSIAPDLKFKIPTPPRQKEIAWIGTNFELQSNDPEQPNLLDVVNLNDKKEKPQVV